MSVKSNQDNLLNIFMKIKHEVHIILLKIWNSEAELLRVRNTNCQPQNYFKNMVHCTVHIYKIIHIPVHDYGGRGVSSSKFSRN